MTLYEACLTLLQVYSRNNLGRQRIDVTAEEEQYQDLLLIMELLTNLLSKEFIDFSDAGEPWATGLQLLLVLLKQRWSVHRPAGGSLVVGRVGAQPFPLGCRLSAGTTKSADVLAGPPLFVSQQLGLCWFSR